MKREIINLKYKILMRKPRMAVASKKKKKVNPECDSKNVHKNDNVELSENIQNLQCGGMYIPRTTLP